MSPCVFPQPFLPPPFSLSLSLSLSCSFFASLFSLFFVLFCVLVLVSFFLFLSSLLLFHEKNNIRILHEKVFIINPFSFSWVSCLVSLSNPFLIFVISRLFKLSFLFNINVFLSSKTSWKTPIWGQEGDCNKISFYSLCFAKCEMWKVITFWGPFFGQIWLIFKKL